MPEAYAMVSVHAVAGHLQLRIFFILFIVAVRRRRRSKGLPRKPLVTFKTPDLGSEIIEFTAHDA